MHSYRNIQAAASVANTIAPARTIRLSIEDAGRQHKLILGASRAARSKPIEPQDALQVGEPHPDLLTLAPRLLEALGAGE